MIIAPIVLVTGADGFVGRHMVSALTQAGWHVRCAQRSVSLTSPTPDVVTGLELGPSTDWQAALHGVQTVIHLAARAHRSKSTQIREEDLYFSINVEGTMQLARSAVLAGVEEYLPQQYRGERQHDRWKDAVLRGEPRLSPGAAYWRRSLV